MITKENLSKILYAHDLVGTSCNRNKGMEDEYDVEARHIVNLLSLGIPFRTALYDVFSFFFWDGCLKSVEFRVTLVEAEYYNQVSKYEIQ